MSVNVDIDKITPYIADIIHSAIRDLAAKCDGAMALDGCGFNKNDTDFGKHLAVCRSLTKKQAAAGAKIAWKYRGQLPERIVKIIGQVVVYTKDKENG